MLKSKSGVALYSIVKEKIIDLIKSGKYSTGDQLPTEAEFCRLFDVSRTTVRIALQQLELEGKVHRVQGKGTFVSRSKIEQFLTTANKGFSQQMIEQGLHPDTQVLELAVIPASKPIADALQVEENDPINKVVRIRFASDEPIQYVVSYIPWRVATGLIHDDCRGSLYELLQNKYQVTIWRTVEAVEPVLSDDSISSNLRVPLGAPCLSIETTTYSTEKLPIEYSYAVFRGDRSKFIIERIYSELQEE